MRSEKWILQGLSGVVPLRFRNNIFCFILGRFSDDAILVGFEAAVSQTIICCLPLKWPIQSLLTLMEQLFGERWLRVYNSNENILGGKSVCGKTFLKVTWIIQVRKIIPCNEVSCVSVILQMKGLVAWTWSGWCPSVAQTATNILVQGIASAGEKRAISLFASLCFYLNPINITRVKIADRKISAQHKRVPT